MSRLLANMLLIVAVLLQCSPLRTCDWSALLTGDSCHAAALAEADTGVHTAEVARHHAGPVTGDENTCVCNTPKGTEDHGGRTPLAPDLTPFVAGPVPVFASLSFPDTTRAEGRDAAPPGPTPPQYAPLLT